MSEVEEPAVGDGLPKLGALASAGAAAGALGASDWVAAPAGAGPAVWQPDTANASRADQAMAFRFRDVDEIEVIGCSEACRWLIGEAFVD